MELRCLNCGLTIERDSYLDHLPISDEKCSHEWEEQKEDGDHVGRQSKGRGENLDR